MDCDYDFYTVEGFGSRISHWRCVQMKMISDFVVNRFCVSTPTIPTPNFENTPSMVQDICSIMTSVIRDEPCVSPVRCPGGMQLLFQFDGGDGLRVTITYDQYFVFCDTALTVNGDYFNPPLPTREVLLIGRSVPIIRQTNNNSVAATLAATTAYSYAPMLPHQQQQMMMMPPPSSPRPHHHHHKKK